MRRGKEQKIKNAVGDTKTVDKEWREEKKEKGGGREERERSGRKSSIHGPCDTRAQTGIEPTPAGDVS